LFIKNLPIDSTVKKFLISLQRRKANKNLLSKDGPYNWVIQISAPSGVKAKLWGDTHFATELKKALELQGQKVEINFRDQELLKIDSPNTIILNLRGLLPFQPVPGVLNVIWIISHPDQISKYELKKYDLVFAASESWSEDRSKKWNLRILPLLQATNPKKFYPNENLIRSSDEFLFIGNTRGSFRKSVKVASKFSQNLKVVGSGWQKYLRPDQIKSEFIENENISDYYQSAAIVLNDHWSDMAKAGFISNRVFDAIASGAKVISDQVLGIDKIFGNSVFTYNDEKGLRYLLNNYKNLDFGSDQEIKQRAIKIGTSHSFELRASEIISKVKAIS
jgi:hypothetical protein